MRIRVSTGARARLTSCRTWRKPSLLRPDRCPAGAGGSEKSADHGLSAQTADHQGEHQRRSTHPVACAVAPAVAPNTLPAPPSAARSGCRSYALPNSYCRIRTASQHPSLPTWLSALPTARDAAIARAEGSKSQYTAVLCCVGVIYIYIIYICIFYIPLCVGDQHSGVLLGCSKSSRQCDLYYLLTYVGENERVLTKQPKSLTSRAGCVRRAGRCY